MSWTQFQICECLDADLHLLLTLLSRQIRFLVKVGTVFLLCQTLFFSSVQHLSILTALPLCPCCLSRLLKSAHFCCWNSSPGTSMMAELTCGVSTALISKVCSLFPGLISQRCIPCQLSKVCCSFFLFLFTTGEPNPASPGQSTSDSSIHQAHLPLCAPCCLLCSAFLYLPLL